MLCSVVNNASHLVSPVMQMMVLPKSITQTKCGFSRLSPNHSWLPWVVPLPQMVHQDNLVNSLVVSSVVPWMT